MKKQSNTKSFKTEPSVRRSNKSRTSPTHNPITQDDQLTQTNNDFSKTQQSFKSARSQLNQSPSALSKFSQSMVSPSRKSLSKRLSQIVTKAQSSQMHERTIIKTLGINLQPLCSIPNHEKNRILYFCQDPECQSQNRLGCSYCQVEFHNNHMQYLTDIQSFCKIFDEKKSQFNEINNTIMKIPDKITPTRAYFQQIRQQFLDKLQHIENVIIQQLQEQLKWTPLETEIVQRVNQLGSKNIFEMNQDELKESLEFIKGKHNQELEFVKKETNNYLKQKIITIDQGLKDFQEQIEQEIINTLNDNSKISFHNPQSKEYAIQKINRFQEKQQKVQQSLKPFTQQLETIYEEERKEEEKKLEEIKIQEEIIQKQKEQEIKKQQEILQIEQENQKKQQLIQQQQEKELEREKLLRTFPYQIITKECNHRIPCNTVPIFACCNKAYSCVQCHGYYAHPPVITMPSYRYCKKCLEIYLVMYSTNQAVDCLKCKQN